MPGRRSIRLKGWDYQGKATYLVTIVTANREPGLGSIADGRVVLSPMGRIVREEWLRVALIRREAHLGAFVVMPDHFHGIVTLDAGPRWQREGPAGRAPCRRRSRSLGALVAGFKAACTVRIRRLAPERFPPSRPVWQRNYHERILDDPRALHIARRYIERNPAKVAARRRGPTPPSAPAARRR